MTGINAPISKHKRFLKDSKSTKAFYVTLYAYIVLQI